MFSEQTDGDNTIQLNQQVNRSLQIGKLDSEEKLHLFSKVRNQSDIESSTATQTEHANAFLEHIPPYPLDVSCAAYYLKATNVPYQTYLKNLNRYHADFESVQESLLKEAGDYTSTRYGILTVSIGQLIEIHPDFLELLLLISLIDSQNIPIDFLNHHKAPETIASFIYHLKKYSLITNEASSYFPSFSLHRSTQAITLAYLVNKLGLKDNSQMLQEISETLESYITAIVKNENNSKMNFLIAHYESFLMHKNLVPENRSASLNAKLGYIHYTLGNYERSRQTHEESRIKLSKCKIENKALPAWNLTHLGQSCRSLGRLEEAKSVLEEASQLYASLLPEYETEFARCLLYLGNVWRDLGNYKKSQEFIEKCVAIYERHPNVEQFHLAEALTYQGQAHWFIGNFKKAMVYTERGYEIYTTFDHENYLRAGWSLAHVGNGHNHTGNYEKAKESLEKSLYFYKAANVIGSDDEAFIYASLAVVYSNLNEEEKALSMLEKSFELYQDHFPKNNNPIARRFKRFQDDQAAKNVLKKVEKIALKSLQVYEEKYGKNHICMARGYWHLAQVHLLENALEKAEQSLNEAVKIFEKNAHPEVHTCLDSLADVYLQKSSDAEKEEKLKEEGEFKEQAIAYLTQALDVLNLHFPQNSEYRKRLQSKLEKYQAPKNGVN